MNTINSITEFHRLVSLPDPLHPLISVVKVADMQFVEDAVWKQFTLNFYCISLKRDVSGVVKYGQQYYDYSKGVMTFIAPNQLQSLDVPHSELLEAAQGDGYAMLIHPDFLYGHQLATAIKNYGFFSYAVNEALHLSEREEEHIVEIFKKIDEEYQRIDKHTQDIILSQIDLLLNYSTRFYERQFITRKKVSNDLLLTFDELLTAHFYNEQPQISGLPSVSFFAEKLFVSPHYLNDMLKNLTGQTTQQHIQNKLIERAKELLSMTNLTVSEIAYQLGFEYPQSFNKLFKNKMNISPLEFRSNFN